MTDSDRDAHPGLNFSGDFDSPTEVLASDLSDADKRAILETWMKDLERAGEGVADSLVDSVRDALARLDGA